MHSSRIVAFQTNLFRKKTAKKDEGNRHRQKHRLPKRFSSPLKVRSSPSFRYSPVNNIHRQSSHSHSSSNYSNNLGSRNFSYRIWSPSHIHRPSRCHYKSRQFQTSLQYNCKLSSRSSSPLHSPSHRNPAVSSPYHSRTPSRHSYSPSRYRRKPSDYNSNPSDQSCTPPFNSHSPSHHSPTPSCQSRTPSRHSRSPSRHSHSPHHIRGRSPLRKNWTSQHCNRGPSRQSCSPLQHNCSPLRYSHSPTQHSRSPSQRSHSPSQHSRSPSQHSRSPSQHSRSSSLQSCTLPHYSPSPSQHSCSPPRYSCSPPRYGCSPSLKSCTSPRFSRSPSLQSYSPPPSNRSPSLQNCGPSPYNHSPSRQSCSPSRLRADLLKVHYSRSPLLQTPHISHSPILKTPHISHSPLLKTPRIGRSPSLQSCISPPSSYPSQQNLGPPHYNHSSPWQSCSPPRNSHSPSRQNSNPRYRRSPSRQSYSPPHYSCNPLLQNCTSPRFSHNPSLQSCSPLHYNHSRSRQSCSPLPSSRSPSRKNCIPPTYGFSPPHYSLSPSLQSCSPPGFSHGTTLHNCSPPHYNRSPSLQSCRSPPSSRSPSRQNRSPPSYSSHPSRLTCSLPNNSSSPLRQRRTPLHYSRSPSCSNRSPSKQNCRSPRQSFSPQQFSHNLPQSYTPLRYRCSSSQNICSPPCYNCSSSQKSCSPLRQNHSPVRQSHSPLRQSRSPSCQSRSPPRRSCTPPQYIHSPSRHSLSWRSHNYSSPYHTRCPSSHNKTSSSLHSDMLMHNYHNSLLGLPGSLRSGQIPFRSNTSPKRKLPGEAVLKKRKLSFATENTQTKEKLMKSEDLFESVSESESVSPVNFESHLSCSDVTNDSDQQESVVVTHAETKIPDTLNIISAQAKKQIQPSVPVTDVLSRIEAQKLMKHASASYNSQIDTVKEHVKKDFCSNIVGKHNYPHSGNSFSLSNSKTPFQGNIQREDLNMEGSTCDNGLNMGFYEQKAVLVKQPDTCMLQPGHQATIAPTQDNLPTTDRSSTQDNLLNPLDQKQNIAIVQKHSVTISGSIPRKDDKNLQSLNQEIFAVYDDLHGSDNGSFQTNIFDKLNSQQKSLHFVHREQFIHEQLLQNNTGPLHSLHQEAFALHCTASPIEENPTVRDKLLDSVNSKDLVTTMHQECVSPRSKKQVTVVQQQCASPIQDDLLNTVKRNQEATIGLQQPVSIHETLPQGGAKQLLSQNGGKFARNSDSSHIEEGPIQDNVLNVVNTKQKTAMTQQQPLSIYETLPQEVPKLFQSQDQEKLSSQCDCTLPTVECGSREENLLLLVQSKQKDVIEQQPLSVCGTLPEDGKSTFQSLVEEKSGILPIAGNVSIQDSFLTAVKRQQTRQEPSSPIHDILLQDSKEPFQSRNCGKIDSKSYDLLTDDSDTTERNTLSAVKNKSLITQLQTVSICDTLPQIHTRVLQALNPEMYVSEYESPPMPNSNAIQENLLQALRNMQKAKTALQRQEKSGNSENLEKCASVCNSLPAIDDSVIQGSLLDALKSMQKVTAALQQPASIPETLPHNRKKPFHCLINKELSSQSDRLLVEDSGSSTEDPLKLVKSEHNEVNAQQQPVSSQESPQERARPLPLLKDHLYISDSGHEQENLLILVKNICEEAKLLQQPVSFHEARSHHSLNDRLPVVDSGCTKENHLNPLKSKENVVNAQQKPLSTFEVSRQDSVKPVQLLKDHLPVADSSGQESLVKPVKNKQNEVKVQQKPVSTRKTLSQDSVKPVQLILKECLPIADIYGQESLVNPVISKQNKAKAQQKPLSTREALSRDSVKPVQLILKECFPVAGSSGQECLVKLVKNKSNDAKVQQRHVSTLEALPQDSVKPVQLLLKDSLPIADGSAQECLVNPMKIKQRKTKALQQTEFVHEALPTDSTKPLQSLKQHLPAQDSDCVQENCVISVGRKRKAAREKQYTMSVQKEGDARPQSSVNLQRHNTKIAPQHPASIPVTLSPSTKPSKPLKHQQVSFHCGSIPMTPEGGSIEATCLKAMKSKQKRNASCEQPVSVSETLPQDCRRPLNSVKQKNCDTQWDSLLASDSLTEENRLNPLQSQQKTTVALQQPVSICETLPLQSLKHEKCNSQRDCVLTSDRSIKENPLNSLKSKETTTAVVAQQQPGSICEALPLLSLKQEKFSEHSDSLPISALGCIEEKPLNSHENQQKTIIALQQSLAVPETLSLDSTIQVQSLNEKNLPFQCGSLPVSDIKGSISDVSLSDISDISSPDIADKSTSSSIEENLLKSPKSKPKTTTVLQQPVSTHETVPEVCTKPLQPLSQEKLTSIRETLTPDSSLQSHSVREVASHCEISHAVDGSSQHNVSNTENVTQKVAIAQQLVSILEMLPQDDTKPFHVEHWRGEMSSHCDDLPTADIHSSDSKTFNTINKDQKAAIAEKLVSILEKLSEGDAKQLQFQEACAPDSDCKPASYSVTPQDPYLNSIQKVAVAQQLVSVLEILAQNDALPFQLKQQGEIFDDPCDCSAENNHPSKVHLIYNQKLGITQKVLSVLETLSQDNIQPLQFRHQDEFASTPFSLPRQESLGNVRNEQKGAAKHLCTSEGMSQDNVIEVQLSQREEFTAPICNSPAADSSAIYDNLLHTVTDDKMLPTLQQQCVSALIQDSARTTNLLGTEESAPQCSNSSAKSRPTQDNSSDDPNSHQKELSQEPEPVQVSSRDTEAHDLPHNAQPNTCSDDFPSAKSCTKQPNHLSEIDSKTKVDLARQLIFIRSFTERVKVFDNFLAQIIRPKRRKSRVKTSKADKLGDVNSQHTCPVGIHQDIPVHTDHLPTTCDIGNTHHLPLSKQSSVATRASSLDDQQTTGSIKCKPPESSCVAVKEMAQDSEGGFEEWLDQQLLKSVGHVPVFHDSFSETNQCSGENFSSGSTFNLRSPVDTKTSTKSVRHFPLNFDEWVNMQRAESNLSVLPPQHWSSENTQQHTSTRNFSNFRSLPDHSTSTSTKSKPCTPFSVRPASARSSDSVLKTAQSYYY